MKANIDWRILLGCFASTWGIALLIVDLLPFVVGTYIGLMGFSEAQAGSLVSVELLAIGITSFLLAPWINKVPVRLVFIGALIAATGNAACLFGDSYGYILQCRLFAGIGCGLLMAIGNSIIASYPEPDRLYGQMTTLTVVMMLILFNIIPAVTAEWDHKGLFGLMVLTMLVLMPLMLLLPHDVDASKSKDTLEGIKALASLPAVIALMMIFTFFTRDTLVWAFAERAGVRVGLSQEEIGLVFSAHAVLGLLGPMIVAVIGTRFGRMFPVIFGILITGMITYNISLTNNQLNYIIMVLIWTSMHFFTLSYLMGSAAAVDNKGRVIAAAGGAMMIGNTVAPVTAGYLIEWKGYAALGWFTIVAVLITAVLAYWLVSYLDKCEAN